MDFIIKNIVGNSSKHLATRENVQKNLKKKLKKKNIEIKIIYAKILTPIVRSPSAYYSNAVNH
jgi:hypothetical protein